MTALGALTPVAMPLAAVAGVAQPFVATAANPVSSFVGTLGQASGIDGTYYSGDPLGDRVIREAAANPLAAGGMAGALDTVSAAVSFVPALGANQPPIPGTSTVIGAANALLGMNDPAAPPRDASFVQNLSPSDFVARSQSNFALGQQLMTQRIAAGGSPREGYMEFAQQLRHVLRPDASGRTAFDHMQASIDVQRQDLIRKLKEKVGNPREIVAKLMSLTIAQGMVQREREKTQELLNLLMSLILGVQIPQGCVERLIELGFQDLVEDVIRQMVGDGKGMSRGMHAQLKQLSNADVVNVSIVQEQDTEFGRRDDLRNKALQARETSDGRGLIDSTGRAVDDDSVGSDIARQMWRRAAGLENDEGEGEGADEGAPSEQSALPSALEQQTQGRSQGLG